MCGVFAEKKINGECVFYLHSLPIFDPSTTCKNLFAIPPEQLQLLFSHDLIVCVCQESVEFCPKLQFTLSDSTLISII